MQARADQLRDERLAKEQMEEPDPEVEALKQASGPTFRQVMDMIDLADKNGDDDLDSLIDTTNGFKGPQYNALMNKIAEKYGRVRTEARGGVVLIQTQTGMPGME